MGKEAKIEKQSKNYAEGLGFYVRKYKTPNNRAAPDGIFRGTDGRFFFIEFKAPGEKPRSMQYREIRKLNSFGECAYWVDNFEDAKAIINKYHDPDKIMNEKQATQHIKSTLEGYLQDWPSIRDLGYTGKDDSSEIEAWFASRHFPKWEIKHGTQRIVFFKCWEGADRELSRMLGFGRAVFKLKKPSETQTDLGDLF